MAIPAYDAEKIPLKRQCWMIFERFLYSLLSLLLGMKIRGCRFTIQSFQFPCTLNNIVYSESWPKPTKDDDASDESKKSHNNRTNPTTQLSRDCTISVSRVSVSFRIPRPSHPQWATIVISSYDYIDGDCRASVDRAVILLSIFPVLFRVSHGPWVSIALHDMHLRVFTSLRFPAWVDAMCTDIISTVLEGDILRINDLYTTVEMGITQSRDEYNDELHGDNNPRGQPKKKKKKNHTKQNPDNGDKDASQNQNGENDLDEARVALNLQRAIIHNSRNRIYSFGSLDLRLGRRESMEAGPLDIAVRDSQWMRAVVLSGSVQEKCTTFSLTTILRIFFRGISGTPSQVYAVIKNPVNAADVYVSRGDVTFDHFRMHDTRIMAEGNKAVGNWFSKNQESTKGFLWDMFSAGLSSLLSPDTNTYNQPEETDRSD